MEDLTGRLALRMTSPTCCRSSGRGFTLLELLLALTILSILVAVSVPAARRSLRWLALKDAALTLAANIRYAQAEAISEGMAARISFDRPMGEYQLEFAPDEAAPKFQRLPGPMGRTFRLPEDAAFTSLELFADDGVTKVGTLTFFADGRGGVGRIEITGSEGSFQIDLPGQLGQVVLTEKPAVDEELVLE